MSYPLGQKQVTSELSFKQSLMILALTLSIPVWLVIFFSLLNTLTHRPELTHESITMPTAEREQEELESTQIEAVTPSASIQSEGILDKRVLPLALPTNTTCRAVSAVLWLREDMDVTGLLTLLNQYNQKYDYLKLTLVTDEQLMEYRGSYIHFSTPDNLEEVESKHLIGSYEKNTCFSNSSNYGENLFTFKQVVGTFEESYGTYLNFE